jgi:hypothetical protein
MQVWINEHNSWEGYTLDEPQPGVTHVAGGAWHEVPAELVMEWRALMAGYSAMQEKLAAIVHPET